MNNIEQLILDCFEGTDWHLSLWFPRITREVVGFPRGVDDASAQACLLRLIENGTLETGVVEGSEFAAQPFQLHADLYIRVAAHVETTAPR